MLNKTSLAGKQLYQFGLNDSLYNIGLKTLVQQGISEPIFDSDLAYIFKRNVGKNYFFW